MAKLVKFTEDIPDNEKKWRGACFFSATGDTEQQAENKIKHLVKKWLDDKGKTHKKDVVDIL